MITKSYRRKAHRLCSKKSKNKRKLGEKKIIEASTVSTTP
jgi:hypothetical protein